MAKSCCREREERIKQYRLDDWKVQDTKLKTFKPDELLYSPPHIHKQGNGIHLLIDPHLPNWMSVNHTGAEVLQLCDGNHSLSDIQDAIQEKYEISNIQQVNHEISEFLSAAGLLEFVSSSPFVRSEYKGRSAAIAPDKLEELWIYTTLACNLKCSHCLVSAGKGLKDELTTEEIKKIVDEAVALGVHRFYITGGEPFIKDNIFELIPYITKEKNCDLIVLTNATLLMTEEYQHWKN